MPWFPNPNGGAPIQAATNPNPAGGSYGLYSDPGYSGPAPSVGGASSSGGGGGGASSGGSTVTTGTNSAAQLQSGVNQLLAAAASGNKAALDETIREFNQTFGLDTQKFQDDVRRFNQNFNISQAGITGYYSPQAPTQDAYVAARSQQLLTHGMTPQDALATANGEWANGSAQTGMVGYGMPQGMGYGPTQAMQQQQYTQQMGMITTAAGLQANPFRQAQALGQMSGLLGGNGVAGFAAPNTVAGVGTQGGNTQGGMGYLQQMIDDIRDPTANQHAMSDVMAGIPTPNKLNSTEFLRSAPSTQSMVLQGMQEKYGLDPNDALSQIKATLPQFSAPQTLSGTIKR